MSHALRDDRVSVDDNTRVKGPPSSRPAKATAGVLLVFGLVAIAAVAWRTVADLPPGEAPGWIGQGLAALAFLLSGVFIVSRQPRNVIGWLLVIPGVLPSLSELVFIWLARMDPPPETASLPVWLAIWFTNWSWILLMFPIFLMLLTFPNGRLLSPRWRWVLVLIGVMTMTMLILTAMGRDMRVIAGETEIWSIPNPIGFLDETAVFDEAFFMVWSPALLTVTLAGVAAVVMRYRRGSTVERQQLKWPVLGVVSFGIVYGIGAISNRLTGWLDVLFGLVLAAIPVTVAIAVLRYRLYEIDRVLSRTVSYAVIVGLLAAAYFGVISLLSTFLPAQSDLTVAASTLAVAALFNPVRRRVQRWVDRRFNRSHYDALRVADEFTRSIRDEIDPSRIVDGWVDVTTATMQPATVGFWTRETRAQL